MVSPTSSSLASSRPDASALAPPGEPSLATSSLRLGARPGGLPAWKAQADLDVVLCLFAEAPL
jgi:hypothetical protein